MRLGVTAGVRAMIAGRGASVGTPLAPQIAKKSLETQVLSHSWGPPLPPPMKKLTPVSDLLAQGQGMLKRLREGTAEADRSLGALRRQLPPELAAAVWGAVMKEETLVVLVRSAAWGTRIRYLAPRFKDALAAELGVVIERVVVKVRSDRA